MKDKQKNTINTIFHSLIARDLTFLHVSNQLALIEKQISFLVRLLKLATLQNLAFGRYSIRILFCMQTLRSRIRMATAMKIQCLVFSAAFLLPFGYGCSIVSSDCPDPALKVDKIDFNSMTLEAASQVAIFDNIENRSIQTSLTLHIRDGINTTLIPAFDQQDLHLEVNGTRINYAHENKVLPGGYGCPEWYYPGIITKTSGTSIQLTVKDNSGRSKNWASLTSIDTATFPIFDFFVANDSLKMFVNPSGSFGNRRPNVQVVDDSTHLYGFSSSIDYFNQFFRLSDFSRYSDTSISEIRKKKYWASVQYSQENVVSLSSSSSIYYAKQLPDSISAIINESRISRISAR